MSRPLRIAVVTLLSAAALAALAELSQARYHPPGADDALLRLSWRVRGIRIQECRRLTPEELEALPAHMRREEVCEGRIAPYRLRVRVDGRLLEDTLVHAAGAREDRPVYVFREFPVGPGVHRVDLDFARVEGRGEGEGEREEGERRHEASARDRDREREGGGRREDDHRRDRPDARGRNGESPARLELDATVDLAAGDVALITYDAERRALVVRRGAPMP